MHRRDGPGLTDSVHSAVRNLAQLVSRQARLAPDRVALVQPEAVRRTVTWTELDSLVDLVSAGLASHGLVAGHRVALCGPNSVEFVVCYFAILRAGFVAVPISPLLAEDDLRAVLSDCGARLLLRTAGPGDTGSETTGGFRAEGVAVLPLDESSLAELSTRGTGPVTSPQDVEALAVLVYTAGTSGDPKAVMLTHRALLAHLEHLEPLEVVSVDTIALAVLPMFGIFGLNAVVGSWAMAGATLVVTNASGSELLDVIEAERVNNLPLAPALLYRLLRHDRLGAALASVRTVVSGAAPLPAKVAAEFEKRTGLRVDRGYGLTEAGPGVAVTLGGSVRGPGHVGRVLPGVAVRIGSGDDDSEPAELWVKGENLFSGYWPRGEGGPDADGWFGTGDIGYLRAGELFLVGRARELIVVNGFQVYPAEVEDVISELAGVSAVAVIGRSGGVQGDEMVAIVVGEVAPQVVLDHCTRSLPKFKRPTEVQLVDDLPLGATGKVRKGALRKGLGAPAPTTAYRAGGDQ